MLNTQDVVKVRNKNIYGVVIDKVGFQFYTVLEQLIKQMRGELMSEDTKWQSFDEDFYRLLKRHSGLEFNADSKTFEWFCKERDKLWSQIQQMENENVQ